MPRSTFLGSPPVGAAFTSLRSLADALAEDGPDMPAPAPHPTAGTVLADLPQHGGASHGYRGGIDSDDDDMDVGRDAIERAARQHRQGRQHRERVLRLCVSLNHGWGVPPYIEPEPGYRPPDAETQAIVCWRFEDGVLELRPLGAFLQRLDSGFALHLHGSGLMAMRDGQWVQEPDQAFFRDLETAAGLPVL
ncbi:hypothetical protein GT347_04375 [Xylophilus rhododendri]|uniref:Uncharacterized protein n=1 Tax=Xylophilus rhododendri TaxID=2697032 RepID=A0A857J2I8_9BURK|nr:hypothetical protein [Xylophilus rhododendri]QHI97282.1 hypothetical protein GT347_04375 [Xylophilus rhododendri]